MKKANNTKAAERDLDQEWGAKRKKVKRAYYQPKLALEAREVVVGVVRAAMQTVGRFGEQWLYEVELRDAFTSATVNRQQHALDAGEVLTIPERGELAVLRELTGKMVRIEVLGLGANEQGSPRWEFDVRSKDA